MITHRASQKVPPLDPTKEQKSIRYRDSSSKQLHLMIFNLNAQTVHLKTVHQTPEIRVHELKLWSAPDNRGFPQLPSHDLISQTFCKGILNY